MDHHPHLELLTLRDLLRWSISRFNASELVFGHGSDNPWDEAAYLLLHALHLAPDMLEPFLDARLTERERERCVELIARRISSRKPAAYITGEAWLQGERFLVDERVLIPRSPISELLADSLAPWVEDPDQVQFVLDMCTGSGCLAILAALAFPCATVHAADIAAPALELARQNITLHGLEDRVFTHQGDLFGALSADICYDLIICNPPYVNSTAMQNLPPEYLSEPQAALAGGADGMDLVCKILQQCPKYMHADSLLVLEIGHEAENFRAAFPELEPIWLSTHGASEQIMLLTKAQLSA